MKNLKALVNFICINQDCSTEIFFNLMELKANKGIVSCSKCYRQYEFSDSHFISKLERLKNLLLAINEADDILDDCSIGVKSRTEEIKIPYNLLLSRLNANIDINVGGENIKFEFYLKPLNQDQQIR